MAFADAYRNQVALLIRALPSVAAEECFAMKGGTAINLFIRDLPRLSVDIDLTYLPVQNRATSLADIDAAMLRIAERIPQAVRGARVAPSRSRENVITKLVVRSDSARIKIEVTPVLRGCVFEPEFRPVSSSVEDEVGFAEMRIVSFPDLYAGKIVAAFDRQHPRDLFDARDLLANEGIDDALRRTFLVYLISHDRPMAEVLVARRKDIKAEFERGFVGMTQQRSHSTTFWRRVKRSSAKSSAQCLILIANSCWRSNEANPIGQQSAWKRPPICRPCDGGNRISIA